MKSGNLDTRESRKNKKSRNGREVTEDYNKSSLCGDFIKTEPS